VVTLALPEEPAKQPGSVRRPRQYARDWIAERPVLRPKTVWLYLYLLRSHLGPAFETRAPADIKEPNIRCDIDVSGAAPA
jgi:hypothetical protein